MTKIKLLALDLDGTLLTSEKTISAENKAAIKLAQSAGVHVVITTGRPLKAIEHILTALDLLDDTQYSITFNGGLVQRNNGEILSKKTFSYAELAEIHAELARLDLPMDVISDGTCYETDPKSLYQGFSPFLDFIEGPFSAIPHDIILNKAVSALDAEVLDEKILEISPLLKEKYEIFKSRDILLELMPKGVIKSFGLEKLTEILGITKENVMAIGDEENDIAMLEWAGIGVAMGNATAQVKSLSDIIAPVTNDEHGVAWAIHNYILEA
ncbi:haloacid dehalogenase [Lactococcus hodotermopsidis]|uniref:Haloacid dehalogenase n=1 Tax=Pseudolactococcus hodotermopsidis TaxID=2709157 RepID=A0A6A0B9C1_9LACT|nr:Cof-type HAD-IIB family hydrolase [Lactococcus hodotermopsidis]GFH42030.1 haloacid dehalogenase [Lactococcus hodotermopsidis]